jgi:hypothetical protein
MAERKTRSTTTGAARAKSPAQESKAQAEFARYKDRVGEGATRAAAFASRLPTSAVPAWSLQPPLPGPPPAAGGPVGWGTPTGPASVDTQSVTQSLGTTIRLGVDVLNAALSSSLTMLGGGVGAARRGESCRCGGGCDRCGPCECDCCDVFECGCGCGCGSCEPSVGTCC